MTEKTFIYFTDGGHGWLQVGLRDLQSVGMNLVDHVTRFSYVDPENNLIYLEEDLDMGTFIRLFSEKLGKVPSITEKHQHGQCFVRNLKRNDF